MSRLQERPQFIESYIPLTGRKMVVKPDGIMEMNTDEIVAICLQ